jgi:hypothetical protein
VVLSHRWLFLSLDLSLLPPQEHWTPNSYPPTTSSSPPPPPSAIPCLKFACQIAALFNHQRERTHTHINLLRSHCHHHIEKKGHRRDASLIPKSLLGNPAKQQSCHRYENHGKNPVIQSFTLSERCISSRSKQQSALCSNNGNYELLRQQFPEERHTDRQTQTQRGVILLPFCTWRFN